MNLTEEKLSFALRCQTVAFGRLSTPLPKRVYLLVNALGKVETWFISLRAARGFQARIHRDVPPLTIVKFEVIP